MFSAIRPLAAEESPDMIGRTHLALALASLLPVILGGCGRGETPSPASSPQRPNVLLVTIDTLRADHVGCYGAADAETPTLDALAAQGTRFESALAPTPLTLPSHTSILTGLEPPRHGVRHNGLYRLADGVETLAERLRGAGYATGAVIGAAVLSRRYGLARGFDSYDDALDGSRAAQSGFHERTAEQVTELARAWLDPPHEPFFLWLHYYDPHLAYRPPSPYAERHSASPYDGEIAYVDHELGRVIDALRSRDLLERTLVVVSADHGESLGEHGERDHSYTLYDSALRVPLIWRGPGIDGGRSVPGVVRSVDIAPTLLARLGLRELPGADGRPLPGLFGPADGREDRLAYGETLATQLDYGWSPLFSMRSADHLFVRAPRPELYELSRDSGQTRNLLAEDSPRAAAIAAALGGEIDRLLEREIEGESMQLEPRELARLRALGYALPDTPVEPTGLDPKDGLPLLAEFRDAVTLFSQGDPAAATVALRRVVPQLPQSALARWVLGNALVQSGRPAEGLRELEEAARLSPRSARYRAMVGEVRRRTGDSVGAAEAYEAAARLDPEEPLAQVGLAWLAWRRGDAGSAETHAREAARTGALEYTIHTLLAELWSAAGRRPETVASLQSALRLRPGSHRTRLFLAIELAQLGRSDEAEVERRAAGSPGRDPQLGLALGQAYRATGALDEAERTYRDMLAARPGDARVRDALAGLLDARARARR